MSFSGTTYSEYFFGNFTRATVFSTVINVGAIDEVADGPSDSSMVMLMSADHGPIMFPLQPSPSPQQPGCSVLHC